MKKYYNPYPFPVRVKNDLDKEQILKPNGGYGKVFGVDYTQSPLKLEEYDPFSITNQKRIDNLDFEIRKVLKEDCIKLAWALGIDESLEDRTKADIVKLIRAVVKKWVK